MKCASLPAALLGLLLAGCASPTPTASQAPSPAATQAGPAQAKAGFPVTVTDAEGRQVTFPAPPERIVSLAPAHTETLYALGAGPRVVAADSYSDYPAEAHANATLNCWPHPPLEKIVALRPDLVLVLTQSRDEIGKMEGAGLPVLKVFPQTYDAAVDSIGLLGKVLGAPDAARKVADAMRARRVEVETRVAGAPAPRVLYELDAMSPARPFVAGNGGFYGDLLRIAGGKNVFADLRAPSGQVSVEQIVNRDPEVVLLGDTRSPAQPQSPALVSQRAGWDGITAVRRRAVYPVDSDHITRPGPRLAQGLDEIARLLHPDRFR